MRRMIPVSDFLHTPESSTFHTVPSCVTYESSRPKMSEDAAIVLANDKRRLLQHLERARKKRWNARKRIA